MTPTSTPSRVCASCVREEIASRAVAYLRSLGADAEVASSSLAVALGVDRATLVASLMPRQVAGELATRTGAADRVFWRARRVDVRLQGDRI